MKRFVRITPRIVGAALIAAALTAPTAIARPASPYPPISGQPSTFWLSVRAHQPAALGRVGTLVSPRPRRCGDLLVSSERLVALPSCPDGWHLISAHREHRGRNDQVIHSLPCTPACDPGVLAHLGLAPADRGSNNRAAPSAHCLMAPEPVPGLPRRHLASRDEASGRDGDTDAHRVVIHA